MSRFQVDKSTVIERLAKAELRPHAQRLIESVLARFSESEVALWIDEPWVELDYEELATDDTVAMVVFADAIDLEEPLTLQLEQLVGFWQARDESAYVFLEPVNCTRFTTVPNCVSVFAGGLEVEDIACFAAPDATTLIDTRLAARVVLSGMGDGSVDIAPNTALEIESFCSYLGSPASLEDVLPEFAEELEDEEPWEFVASLVDEED